MENFEIKINEISFISVSNESKLCLYDLDECREGAVCQWHTLSADRSGAKTAVCQWHTLSADQSGA